MATTSVSIDSLTKDERAVVVAALQLKSSSVSRALKAESNPVVREARSQELMAIDALITRFR